MGSSTSQTGRKNTKKSAWSSNKPSTKWQDISFDIDIDLIYDSSLYLIFYRYFHTHFFFLFVIMFYKFNFVIWSVYKKRKKKSPDNFFQTNKKIIINCVN